MDLNMQFNGNNLKLAIQKEGRLTERSIGLLKAAGFEFDYYKNRLTASVSGFPLDILFVRDDDIPEYVKDGVCDMGIVGKNIIQERKAHVTIRENLGFGMCRIAIAVPKVSQIQKIEDLKQKKVATSYPETLRRFLVKHKITVEIVRIRGSVELAPSLGVADAICDIVSTGSTLRTHELREIASVVDSEAVLISAETIAAKKKEIMEQFMMRVRGVLRARRTKYIMLNAPRPALETIKAVIPGRKSPTVVQLADKELVAVHSVVSEDIFWHVIERLKGAGATDILVLPIEKIID